MAPTISKSFGLEFKRVHTWRRYRLSVNRFETYNLVRFEARSERNRISGERYSASSSVRVLFDILSRHRRSNTSGLVPSCAENVRKPTYARIKTHHMYVGDSTGFRETDKLTLEGNFFLNLVCTSIRNIMRAQAL